MKNQMKRKFYFSLFVTGLCLLTGVHGQNGDPPPPPANHGLQQNQPVGGGAPVGEGLFFLTFLGAGYAIQKWRFPSRKKEEILGHHDQTS
jgi:hypothetical protein